MTQPTEISCPHCHRSLRVPEQATGRQIRCPQCQFILTVSGSAQPQQPVEQRWSLKTADGQVYGPVTRSELDLWMNEGRVDDSCQLRNEATGRWVHAGDVYYHFARPARPLTSGIYADVPYSHEVSDKSRLGAVLLGSILPFFGLCGIHRIYTGHVLIGILQLFTYGGCLVWQVIDVVLLITGSPRDAHDRPLVD